MARNPPPLTQKMVDQLSEPLTSEVDPKTGEPPKRLLVNDGGCVGLSLRTGRGTPTWIVRATTGGLLRKVFGDPRTMSLEIARKITAEARDHHHAGGAVDDQWVAAAQVRHGILPPTEAPYVEPDGPWTWQQGAEAFFQNLRRKKRSEVTILAYRRGLLTQLKDFSDLLIRDVTFDDIQAEIDRLHILTPALALQALKAARPFSQWFSIGPQRLKSGVETHPFKKLTLPKGSRKEGFARLTPVHLSEVARLVAICRTVPLEPATRRALEVTILSGLRRSAVVTARHEDIVDGVWTIRADALKRKVPMKLVLTDRLKELMTSDDDDEWIFVQPRKNKGRQRSHLSEAAIGRAQWEVPSAPTTSECHAAMVHYLMTDGYDPDYPPMTNLLTDAGATAREGGDDVKYGGRAAWQIRSAMVETWGRELEPLILAHIPEIDVDDIMEHVLTMRPKSG